MDSELFTFARQQNWKAALDPKILAQIGALLEDYESVLSRIRACRVSIREKPRKRDIDRILYARGQDDFWDAEELYAQLQDLDAEQAARIRRAMAEEQWHFMGEDERERFLMTWLPGYAGIFDVLMDLAACSPCSGLCGEQSKAGKFSGGGQGAEGQKGL